MRKKSSKCLTETGKAVYGLSAGKKEEIFLKIPFPSGNLNWRQAARIRRNPQAAKFSREFEFRPRGRNSAISSTYCLSYLLFRIEAISRSDPSAFAEIRNLIAKIQFLFPFFLFQTLKSDLSPSSLLTRTETFEFLASPAPVIGRVTRSGSPPLLRSRRKTDKSMRRPEAKPQPWKARSRD